MAYSEGKANDKEFQLFNTRYLAWSNLVSHTKKGKKLEPEHLFSLPSDGKIKRESLTPNVDAKTFLKMKKKIKKRFNEVSKLQRAKHN